MKGSKRKLVKHSFRISFIKQQILSNHRFRFTNSECSKQKDTTQPNIKKHNFLSCLPQEQKVSNGHKWKLEKASSVGILGNKDLQNRCTKQHSPVFERLLSIRIPSKKLHPLEVGVMKVKSIYLSFSWEPLQPSQGPLRFSDPSLRTILLNNSITTLQSG